MSVYRYHHAIDIHIPILAPLKNSIGVSYFLFELCNSIRYFQIQISPDSFIA